MRGPEIISFDKSVIEWTADSVGCFFVLEINGKKVAEGDVTRYRLPPYDCEIKIIAMGNGRRACTKIKYDASRGTLEFLPVDVRVDGERISWDKAGGACAYRVYDVEFNAVTVTRNGYDLSDRNIAVCVCPDSCGGIVKSAEPVIDPSIPYLSGAGTEAEPYAIKTPFGLRAVDYYETVAARDNAPAPKRRNHYRIENTLDYGEIGTLEGESNLYTLKKPFFGTLDGNNNRLINVRVGYDGGYWALFDYVTAYGRIKNTVFENVEIVNNARDCMHPINSSVALVAYRNDGEITGVKLDRVRLTSAGGGIGGIVVHNYGKVTGCTVLAECVQAPTREMGAAEYETAGVVLENHGGGIVGGNRIISLYVRGAQNVRSAAGIVSVNRAGGAVIANEFDKVSISGAVANSEYGGLVAYNAGTVDCSGSTLGVMTVNGERVETLISSDGKGKAVGKNDGEIK